jgi:hypothetical protein
VETTVVDKQVDTARCQLFPVGTRDDDERLLGRGNLVVGARLVDADPVEAVLESDTREHRERADERDQCDREHDNSECLSVGNRRPLRDLPARDSE